MIDEKYLPFEPEELHQHFPGNAKKQIDYFIQSAERYHEFLAANPDLKGIPVSRSRRPMQIEKDERFWTAAALKSIFDHPDSYRIWESLLVKGFGDEPPIRGISTWSECLKGDLYLFFEAQVPSPQKYTQWLRQHFKEVHFIPYVLDAAERKSKRSLEGPTHLDAILVNASNGFSVLFESKVLSDISVDVTFDIKRNQLARCIDILLKENKALSKALGKREPEKSLFLLLTPEVFRENPWSRLYGWLFNEYVSDPAALSRDLPHRDLSDCMHVSSRLGWVTFEEINSICPRACGWMV
ncbi:MAG: hypothetical protein U9R53_08865 [Chloroflexota bacterium]|nr:hypothetical protein [Chloroflexota bacterium]